MVDQDLKRELQELSARLRQAEQVANESQAEAAVYRELLEDLYKAADKALNEKDLSLLHKITGKLDFGWMPPESEVKLWGQYFLHAYVRDAAWLKRAKQSLERIKASAEGLNTEDNQANAELKERIIDDAKDGLITHV